MTSDAPLVPTRPETAIKAALALIPVVGGALSVVADDHMARRRARVEEMVTDAVAYLDGDGTELVERVGSDEEFADMFFTAVQGASESHVEAKRKAFARLLAEGVGEDPGELDVISLMINALSELELIHLRTLQRLSKLEHTGRLRSMIAATPDPVFAALRRNGLLKEEEQYDETEITGISDFGARLLAYVEAAGEIPPE